jgi:hypothetical protein
VPWSVVHAYEKHFFFFILIALPYLSLFTDVASYLMLMKVSLKLKLALVLLLLFMIVIWG